MAPRIHNLEMRRGDTPIWRLTATYPDGTPFPLAGLTLRLVCRVAVADAAPLFTLAAGSGITVIDAAGGVFEAVPPASATSGLTATTHAVYEVEASGGGRTHTLIAGRLSIIADVAR